MELSLLSLLPLAGPARSIAVGELQLPPFHIFPNSSAGRSQRSSDSRTADALLALATDSASSPLHGSYLRYINITICCCTSHGHPFPLTSFARTSSHRNNKATLRQARSVRPLFDFSLLAGRIRPPEDTAEGSTAARKQHQQHGHNARGRARTVTDSGGAGEAEDAERSHSDERWQCPWLMEYR